MHSFAADIFSTLGTGSGGVVRLRRLALISLDRLILDTLLLVGLFMVIGLE